MNRPYYKDPLAAAWMAKRFSMKLYRITTQDMVDEYGCGEVGEQFDWNDSSIMQDVDTVGDLVAHLYDVDYGPIYIHPDSLHLLEPQVGDLCMSDIGTFGLYRVVLKPFGMWFDGRNLKIIQRNSIAFILPES